LKANLRIAAAVCLAAASVSPALAQDAGAATFKLKCAMCHGSDGLAATPAGKVFKAASFLDPAIVKAPDAELIAVVKNGKNKMPAWAGKLTDDQIAAVVAYIRTLQKPQ
jgi:mono/diheme cytochrome c family protein